MRSTDSDGVPLLEWPPSEQERALVAELRELDRSLDVESWERGETPEGAGPGWEPDDVEVIESVLSHGVDPWSLVMLTGIDPETLLDPIHRVGYLQAVAAYVAARQQRALVAVAGAASSGDLRIERHVEHEVAIARRSTRGRAGRDIEIARTLAEEFRATATALEAGEITLEHAAALVVGTRFVASAVARAEVERRVLPVAASCSPVRLRRHVDAAVCAVDAEDQARRHARARADRQVWVRRIENGLGELIVIDAWSVVSAMFERITSEARDLQRERRTAACATDATATGDDARAAAPTEVATAAVDGDDWAGCTLDNCRADALADLVLTDDDPDDDGDVDLHRGDDGPPGRDRGEHRHERSRRRRHDRRRPPRIEGRLVIDLHTLRGEADHPCLLDGSPVPAQVGRRLARDIAHWRRMVTDPVDGHLLDYGRRTYLPETLRTYVLERDTTCRNPWCDQPTTRCQLDHATEYPTGPSDTTNTGALCQDCHRIKTDRAAFLDASAPDGSAVWRTAWGQRVPITPTRYLDDGGSTPPTTPDTRPPGRGTIPGMLDRHADSPARRTLSSPDDTGDTPPF